MNPKKQHNLQSPRPIRQLAIGHRQSAFTVIELLVVISIILVLIGLFLGGLKIITGQAKERDTKTALETCKTMFANYQQATHLSKPPPQGPGPYTVGSSGSPSTTNVAGNNFYNSPRFWIVGEESAPGAVSSDISAYANGNLPEAIVNTAYAMYAFESLPENKAIITNLPPDKVINVTIEVGSTASFQIVSVPILRDGWGNPIIFVPAGGLGATPGNSTANQIAPGVVWLDGANCGIVTSGSVINSASASFSAYDASNSSLYPTGTGFQPFFVSAGPDGDFSNGHAYGYPATPKPTPDMADDNIYSFK